MVREALTFKVSMDILECSLAGHILLSMVTGIDEPPGLDYLN